MMNRWQAVGGVLHERGSGGAGLRCHHHALHHRARLLRRLPQVVGALHAQPHFCTGAQQVRQAQRHVGRNADVPVQDARQVGAGHAQLRSCLRDADLGQPFLQHCAGMGWGGLCIRPMGHLRRALLGGRCATRAQPSLTPSALGLMATVVFRKALRHLLFALPQQCDLGWCQPSRFG